MFRLTKNTTIGELLSNYPEAKEILANLGMHCVSCPSALRETIEQAAEVHGLDADELVDDLIGFMVEG